MSIVKYGDGIINVGRSNDVKSDMSINNLNNKRVTILTRKGERGITTKNKMTHFDLRLFGVRTFLSIVNSENLIIEFVPTNLKKNRVYIEDINSIKLRNILVNKFRRINN